MNSCSTRRVFLIRSTIGGLSLLAARAARSQAPAGRLHVAASQWPWTQFYRREGRDFLADLDAGLAEVARSGVQGYEPGASGPEVVVRLAPLLKKHGLEMRSLYMNSLLHKADEVEKSIAVILATAEKARAAGARIIVINPSPIRWGGPEDKDDAQLAVQAAALDRLGARLRDSGLTLAYHNHDAEMRNAAREFHHMMLATEPRNVTLCLDAHWIYRGAGNSSVALFNIVKLYGPRVRELHLRQSVDRTWTEAFGDGEIDHRALAKRLASLGLKPHIVLEQAPEKGSSATLDAVESHRRGRAYAAEVFRAFIAKAVESSRNGGAWVEMNSGGTR